MKLGIIVSLFILSVNAIPNSVDWRRPCPTCRDLVKNEGNCGSSYAFAAIGALEGALMRKYSKQQDLSEQQIIDCSRSRVNDGCGGGLVTETFEYIIRNGGINSQSDYPYTGRVGTCKYNSTRIAGYITSYTVLPDGDEKALTEAIASIGPIAAAIDAGTIESMYSGGIYNDPNCNSNNLNHAVLIVGYGEENGEPYYLVKNSWGTGWGEGGYFRIARNSGNMCGIASMASYPIV